MLNARNAIRERGQTSLGISLRLTDNPGSLGADNRKVYRSVSLLFSAVAHQIIGLGNRHQSLDRWCRNQRICYGSQSPRWR